MNKPNRTSGCFFWSVPIALLTVAALYWSWCWGWWGQNRYLRYFLQCNCPAASEEARYPIDVDVLVSACEDPFFNGAVVSPSGRFAFFQLHRGDPVSYLYDRETDTMTQSLGSGLLFLTDEIGLRPEKTNVYAVYNLAGERLTHLSRLLITDDFIFNPTTLNILRRANQVYILNIGLAVVLGPNFQISPEESLLLDGGGFSSLRDEKLSQMLEKNGIKFVFVKEGPTNLIETKDIYFVGGEPPTPGVVRVPQPLLKKRLPLESYAPEARPGIEARWAQEETAKVQAAVVFWGIISGALVTGLIIWRRRRLVCGW